ncbi:MAG: Rap1a/Tai family immunity protein [Pseudomonadales bacterium]
MNRLAVLLLLVSSVAHAEYFQSTRTIVARCEKPIEDIADQNAQLVQTEQSLPGCYGYLMAVADIVDGGLPYFKDWVCFPPNIDLEQLRGAFLSHAATIDISGSNPAYVAIDAFTAYWPCPDQQ